MITSDGEQSAGLHDAAELPQRSAQFMAQLTNSPLAQMARQRLMSCVIYYRCKASLSPCMSMYVLHLTAAERPHRRTGVHHVSSALARLHRCCRADLLWSGNSMIPEPFLAPGLCRSRSIRAAPWRSAALAARSRTLRPAPPPRPPCRPARGPRRR